MNARIALVALAMAAAAPAYATTLIDDLSQATGLSPRKVQMIVGNRTPYAEYTRSYDRSLAQFKRALGNERAERVIAGEPFTRERSRQARVAVLDERRTVDRTP